MNCKSLLILISCLIYSYISFAQSVGINDSGAAPDASAMLDVQANDKGVLVPRLTSVQRTGIAGPAVGLLVFDTDTESFWFNATGGWVELTDTAPDELHDADNDTRVQVEESPDEDIIRFDVAGVEALHIARNASGIHYWHTTSTGRNNIIGYNAGQNTSGSYNVFLGHEAAANNTTGNSSAFMGYRAGYRHTTGARNVFVGYEAGFSNSVASFNTFLGFESGRTNSTGAYNTFLGYRSGRSNLAAYNTFIGNDAGYNNTSGLRNTFLGSAAGLANRTGDNNVVLGEQAAGSSAGGSELGDQNNIVGSLAGFHLDGGNSNNLLGYRAGYNLSSGEQNTYIGHQSGYSNSAGIRNIGIGTMSLFNATAGNANIAIGDSALYSNQTGSNLALGSKAGFTNTTGSANIFIGTESGFLNTTGGSNVFIGRISGRFNTIGSNNTFVGAECGYYNISGERNTFIGYAAGFRSTLGSMNTLVGRSAGEYLSEADDNVAVGERALYNEVLGGANTAVGKEALFTQSDRETARETYNTALGYRAGYADVSGIRNTFVGAQAGGNTSGNFNTFVGAMSSANVSGSANTFVGYQAGNGALITGTNNILLGNSTSAGLNINNGTALGHQATVLQNNAVILGNSTASVGIGTGSPSARFELQGTAGDIDIFEVNVGNNTKLKVWDNGSVIIGTHLSTFAPGNSLWVTGQTRFDNDVHVTDQLLVGSFGVDAANGYIVSVDGNIACEEVRVQLDQNWPDYVFKSDYQLPTLSELSAYIQQHQHLPGIPSAKEVEADGIHLGDMNKRLLEKIEELTLYMLQQEKRIQNLEQQLQKE